MGCKGSRLSESKPAEPKSAGPEPERDPSLDWWTPVRTIQPGTKYSRDCVEEVEPGRDGQPPGRYVRKSGLSMMGEIKAFRYLKRVPSEDRTLFPRVVQMHTGELGGWIVMEHFDGVYSGLRDPLSVSTADVRRFTARLARALRAWHEASGRIHGDLALSNIAFRASEGSACPVLIDFGMSEQFSTGGYLPAREDYPIRPGRWAYGSVWHHAGYSSHPLNDYEALAYCAVELQLKSCSRCPHTGLPWELADEPYDVPDTTLWAMRDQKDKLGEGKALPCECVRWLVPIVYACQSAPRLPCAAESEQLSSFAERIIALTSREDA